MCWTLGDGMYSCLSVCGTKFYPKVERDGFSARFKSMPLAPKDPIRRFEQIATPFVAKLAEVREQNPDSEMVVAVEGYAMAAKGRVFHIAENTAVLKYLLWSVFRVATVDLSPSEVKKNATGKGNADKVRMAEAFHEYHGFRLHELIGVNEGASPASDVIDSFYVCRTLEHKLSSGDL